MLNKSDEDRELALRKKFKNDFPFYAKYALKIRSKTGSVVPLKLNKAQTFIHKKVSEQLEVFKRVRVILLKGRQQGGSTYIQARFYWKVTHTSGVKAFILTHEEAATSNIFSMTSLFNDGCPSQLKASTGASNAKELAFNKLASGYKVGTAGNKSAGRSSTIQFFHGSEVGYWPNAAEHATGIMEAIPDDDGTEVFLESTANGIGGYFHKQWQKAEAGESDFIAVFVPWYWQDEYQRDTPKDFKQTEEEASLSKIYGLTNSQLAWRRNKIVGFSAGDSNGEFAFKQEYPCCSAEAFQTADMDGFISVEDVYLARTAKVKPYGGLVLGVDPSRFGKDRTSMIFRRGRFAFGLKSYSQLDTMQIVGLIVKNIEDREQSPQPIIRVFVDVGGLGAGIVDRLRELGYGHMLTAVDNGTKATKSDRFTNKGVEMWHTMKEWLHEAPVKIPDSDSLQADLCTRLHKPPNSNGALVLETKKEMIKRGVRSPDEADALALTFAHPVGATKSKVMRGVNTNTPDSKAGW